MGIWVVWWLVNVVECVFGCVCFDVMLVSFLCNLLYGILIVLFIVIVL